MRAANAHRHRVFFALTFTPDICQQLDRWRRHIPLSGGRWIAMANFHLTLSFLGDVDDRLLEQLLQHPFATLPPFDLPFGQLGYFSKAQVLFVHPNETPDTLLQLQKSCEQLKASLRLGKPEAHYTAHISLARDAIAPIPAATQLLNFSSRHHAFCLMQSQPGSDGVHYRVLQSWPLRRPLRPQIS
jgi:2'-5' RNA ligase